MHGRPRKSSGDAASAASEEKRLAKANHVRSVQSQVLKNHHDKLYTKEALQVSATLLEINPEVYTAWNYRKLAVKHMLESESDSAVIRQILDEELGVVERALKVNYKSYGAWHHRKWVIEMGHSSLDHELRLLDQFLKADARNFHGWKYRRFIAEVKRVSNEEELQFTTKKINENFSNYSAWHNRSALLSGFLKDKSEGDGTKEHKLTEEYDLVRQALFTDSEDQSGWFYHQWLIGQTVAPKGPRLVATWPTEGSNLHVDFHHQSHAWVASFDTPFGIDHCTHIEGIPIILHFSEPVKEVNDSTVQIKSGLLESQPDLWQPLSIHGLQAKTWVAMLSISRKNFEAGKCYTVQVTVAHDSRRVSSNGYECICPTVFNFSLEFQPLTTECTRDKSETVAVAWEGEKFSPVKVSQHKSNIPLEMQFDHLSIDRDLHLREISKWQQKTLETEIMVCRKLLEIERDSKWAKLTLARLLLAHDALSNDALFGSKRMHTDEVLQLFNDLVEIDPSRAGYYKDQFSLVLLDQVTGSKERLQEHCWDSKCTDSLSENHQNRWLRLHCLSLSRIDFMERLLWVQRLDVSHNRIRSIDGLESLQLLSSLNLSFNLLANFTALGPLRLIKTLRVLNIACNEIGAHPVDTTRYSLPSALNNSYTSRSHGAEDQNVLGSHWEITLVFKGLPLKQLDIAGNPANNEICRRLLIEVLPMLKWLDVARSLPGFKKCQTCTSCCWTFQISNCLMICKQYSMLAGLALDLV